MRDWRTRVHWTTQKSSGTQRAGISIPREFMAKAQSWRQPEKTKWIPKRRTASWNTQLVKAQSKSKYQACQLPSESTSKDKVSGKMRREQVQKWDKANGKISQSKMTKFTEKISEVNDLWSPEMKDAERCVGQPRSPKVYQSSEVYRTTMEINSWFESKLVKELQTSQEGMTMSK